MIRVLVTGFERFGREPLNPTEELVARLDGEVVGRAIIYGVVLPVSYNRSKRLIRLLLGNIEPDIILSFGLSSQRTIVSIEKIALNYAHSRTPDNDGIVLKHNKIIENGPLALESTLNVEEAVKVLLDNNVPAIVSYHAGTFLCNYVFYLMLYYSLHTSRIVGFIHIPYTHRDVVEIIRRSESRIPPSIDYEKLYYAIRKLILFLAGGL